METEIPALVRARESAGMRDATLTFHSSRMRMKKVVKAELEAMDRDSIRCAAELADAPVDVVGYACLVVITSMGAGYHRKSEAQLYDVLKREGRDVPVVTSVGALVDELKRSGVRSISVVTPYVRPLTDLVVDYIQNEGIIVKDSIRCRSMTTLPSVGAIQICLSTTLPDSISEGSTPSCCPLRSNAIAQGHSARRRLARAACDVGRDLHGPQDAQRRSARAGGS
ncbi:hypothetical protein [Bradyrhizobium sp. BRP22]|uniref:aspartate racemase/maleate isomerase family protein n=1 Tax=Bradyrhizobium sp. BRP22 TaxID=2793821 RepID=UPI0023DF1ED0|nr:hypothetical protein [Bradyrhizobium sp. BRP22]